MWVSEQTFFHELRELIESEFRRLGYPIATASGLEERAEDFAAQVRAFSMTKAITPMFDGIGKIESGFGRVVVGVGVFLFIAAFSLHCLLLPHFEDRLPK